MILNKYTNNKLYVCITTYAKNNSQAITNGSAYDIVYFPSGFFMLSFSLMQPSNVACVFLQLL